MMPTQSPEGSNAWKSGIDEFGRVWQEHILPYHRKIVDELSVPVIWHSDGDIRKLLPYAVQAGFIGVHGLDPISGIKLQEVKYCLSF